MDSLTLLENFKFKNKIFGPQDTLFYDVEDNPPVHDFRNMNRFSIFVSISCGNKSVAQGMYIQL